MVLVAVVYRAIPLTATMKRNGGKMKVEKILAFDLATRTGFATVAVRGFCPDGIIDSGYSDFALKRGESPGMRYVKFITWLDFMFICDNKVEYDLIIYEQAHHRGGPATEIAYGFVTHLQAWCAKYKVEHTNCHTATLKKFATGNGRASKEDMIKRANELVIEKGFDVNHNHEIKDDNEADAICLLAYAEQQYGGKEAGSRLRPTPS